MDDDVMASGTVILWHHLVAMFSGDIWFATPAGDVLVMLTQRR